LIIREFADFPFLKWKAVMITNPELLQEVADRHRRIVEIANADPTLRIRDIAEMTDYSVQTVQLIFRRNNINRKNGRPKKVSNV